MNQNQDLKPGDKVLVPLLYKPFLSRGLDLPIRFETDWVVDVDGELRLYSRRQLSKISKDVEKGIQKIGHDEHMELLFTEQEPTEDEETIFLLD